MNKQVGFWKFLPVALMIGVAAGLVVYASSALSASYPWAGVIWPIFIGWALYFMAGAKVSRMHKYILGLTGGVVYGWLVLFVLGFFTNIFGATLALPIIVFLAATSIVLLELTDWFELAPAYFFSFAAYFAFLFGGFGGEGVTNTMAAFYVWVLVMAGLAVGFITATLRKLILNVERVPFECQGTIFDKEN